MMDIAAEEQLGQLHIKWTKPTSMHRVMKSLLYYHRIESTDRPPYTDVDIYCKGGYIPVHSVVLLACSDIWREAFETMSPLQREHVIVHMTEYDIEDVTAVIECLYTGKCIFPAQRNQHVLEVFENFGIDSTPLTPKPATEAEIAGKMKMRRYLEDVVDDIHDNAESDKANLAILDVDQVPDPHLNGNQPRDHPLEEDAASSVSKYVEEGEEIVLSDLETEEEAELTGKTVEEVKEDRRIRRGDFLAEGDVDLEDHDEPNPELPEQLDPEAEAEAEMNENSAEGSDECSESQKRGSKRDRGDSSLSSTEGLKRKKSKTQGKSKGAPSVDEKSSSSKRSEKTDSSQSDSVPTTRRLVARKRLLRGEDESITTGRTTRQSSKKENEDHDERRSKSEDTKRPERRSKIEGSSRIHKMFEEETSKSKPKSGIAAATTKSNKDIDKDIEPAELCEIRHCRITLRRIPPEQFKTYWLKFRSNPEETPSEAEDPAVSEASPEKAADAPLESQNDVVVEPPIPSPTTETQTEENEDEMESEDVDVPNVIVLTAEDYNLRSIEWSSVVRRCSVCNTEYGSHVGAKRCLKSHNMTRCWICLKVFGDMSLEDHFKEEHEGDSLKPGYANCPLCPDVMPCSSIQSHVIGKHLALISAKKEHVQQSNDAQEIEIDAPKGANSSAEDIQEEIDTATGANSSAEDLQEEETEGFIRIKPASQLFEVDPDDGDEAESYSASAQADEQGRSSKASKVLAVAASESYPQSRLSDKPACRMDISYTTSIATEAEKSFLAQNTAPSVVTQPNPLPYSNSLPRVTETTTDSLSLNMRRAEQQGDAYGTSTPVSAVRTSQAAAMPMPHRYGTEEQAQRVAGGIRNYFSDNSLMTSVSQAQAQVFPHMAPSTNPSMKYTSTNVGDHMNRPAWGAPQNANATVVLRSASVAPYSAQVTNPNSALLPAGPFNSQTRVAPPSLSSVPNPGRNNQYILNSANTNNTSHVFCGRTQFDGFPFAVYRENSEVPTASNEYMSFTQNATGLTNAANVPRNSTPTPAPNNMVALAPNESYMEQQCRETDSYAALDLDQFTYDNTNGSFTCKACKMRYQSKETAQTHLCFDEPD